MFTAGVEFTAIQRHFKTAQAAKAWLTKNYSNIEFGRQLYIMDDYNQLRYSRLAGCKKWREWQW